jgi:hypothetical protein
MKVGTETRVVSLGLIRTSNHVTILDGPGERAAAWPLHHDEQQRGRSIHDDATQTETWRVVEDARWCVLACAG